MYFADVLLFWVIICDNNVVPFCLLTVFSFSLMISYLTWGVLQEKIMTREYIGNDGITKAFFKDSQFLVFANRLLAFVIAVAYLMFKREKHHRAPLFKYSFASFSNIMSAWLQYEALKFISFPTQVNLFAHVRPKVNPGSAFRC